MAFCETCGSQLSEGAKFCSNCGATVTKVNENGDVAAAQPMYPAMAEAPEVKRKSVFRRWWFWAIVVIIAAALFMRLGAPKALAPFPRPAGTSTASPATAQDGTIPEESRNPAVDSAQETEQSTIPESEIRPEVKEFLDSYEAFMNEYVDFMEKYRKADATDMAAMMMDYAEIMRKYADYADKIEKMNTKDLTAAELAYYIEVTSRVSQRLILVTAD